MSAGLEKEQRTLNQLMVNYRNLCTRLNQEVKRSIGTVGIYFTDMVSETYSQLIYNGLWFSPLKAALDAFVPQTQERVSGTVRMKLFKGNATIVGRRSDNSLYNPEMATYGAEDQFDHKAAEGFIYIWGMPTRIWSGQNNS